MQWICVTNLNLMQSLRGKIHRFCNSFELVTQILCADQQKPAWLESGICAICALYVATLLTTDNRPFLHVKLLRIPDHVDSNRNDWISRTTVSHPQFLEGDFCNINYRACAFHSFIAHNIISFRRYHPNAGRRKADRSKWLFVAETLKYEEKHTAEPKRKNATTSKWYMTWTKEQNLMHVISWHKTWRLSLYPFILK